MRIRIHSVRTAHDQVAGSSYVVVISIVYSVLGSYYFVVVSVVDLIISSLNVILVTILDIVWFSVNYVVILACGMGVVNVGSTWWSVFGLFKCIFNLNWRIWLYWEIWFFWPNIYFRSIWWRIGLFFVRKSINMIDFLPYFVPLFARNL